MKKLILILFTLFSTTLFSQNSWVDFKVQYDFYYQEASWDIVNDSSGAIIFQHTPTYSYQYLDTTINLQAGNHTISWDASDISSGVYIVKFQAGGIIDSKKIMFVK